MSYPAPVVTRDDGIPSGIVDPNKVWLSGTPLEPATGVNYTFEYQRNDGATGQIGTISHGGIYFDHYHQVSFVMERGYQYRFFYGIWGDFPASVSESTGWYEPLTTSAPSNFVRVDEFDSNTFNLSWKNNPTEDYPYQALVLQVSTNGGEYAWVRPQPSATDQSYSYQGRAGNVYSFKLYAYNDMVGASDTINLANQYGKPNPPDQGIITIDKSKMSVIWLVDAGVFSGFTFSTNVFKSVSYDDGSTWTDWEETPYSYNPSFSTISVSLVASKKCVIRLRTMSMFDGLQDGVQRTSAWSLSESGIAYPPIAPYIEFNEQFYDGFVEIVQDDTGESEKKRTLKLYLNDEVVSEVGSIPDTTEGKVKYFDPPSSSFTAKASISTEFWDEEVFSETLVLDFDKAPLFVGDKRYGVFIVYEDGKVIPASVEAIK